MKDQIVVSKKYGNEIKVRVVVTNEDITISMNVEHYKTAMKKEIGQIWSTWTQETFAKKFDAAHDAVIKEMKDRTADVMEGSNS
jgi:hypothetical protein